MSKASATLTADAGAEPCLPKDLGDGEIPPCEFNASTDRETPDEELERKERLKLILRALARVREQDLVVFDLFAIEGLPKESVAKIVNIPADQVPMIAEQVKAHVLQEFEAERRSMRRKAP
jgi:DNA-directed RNA polymerase specialized sigma24 family protein